MNVHVNIFCHVVIFSFENITDKKYVLLPNMI